MEQVFHNSKQENQIVKNTLIKRSNWTAFFNFSTF